MKTIEYLDAIKAKHGLKSDYKLAQVLGVMTNQVAQYRKGGTFGDAVSIRVAELLGVDAGSVAADVRAERAKLEPEKKMWREAAKKLRGHAAPLLLFIVAAVLLRDSDQAVIMSVALAAVPFDSLHIIRSYIRRARG